MYTPFYSLLELPLLSVELLLPLELKILCIICFFCARSCCNWEYTLEACDRLGALLNSPSHTLIRSVAIVDNAVEKAVIWLVHEPPESKQEITASCAFFRLVLSVFRFVSFSNAVLI